MFLRFLFYRDCRRMAFFLIDGMWYAIFTVITSDIYMSKKAMGKRVTACSVEVYVCCFCCPCVCTIQFIFFAGCRRFLIELSCSCCCCWCCSIVIFVLKLNGNAIVFKRANLLQFSFIALSCRVLSTPPPFSLPSHLHLVVCHVIATCRSERDGQYGWEWDSCVKIKDAFFLNFQLTFLCFTALLN